MRLVSLISIFSVKVITMRSMRKMGAHKVICNGKEGVYSQFGHPMHAGLQWVGDFNGWDFEADYMERQEPLGIYTLFVPGVKEGDLYKFCIETEQGKRIFKADPFANYAELRPERRPE